MFVEIHHFKHVKEYFHFIFSVMVHACYAEALFKVLGTSRHNKIRCISWIHILVKQPNTWNGCIWINNDRAVPMSTAEPLILLVEKGFKAKSPLTRKGRGPDWGPVTKAPKANCMEERAQRFWTGVIIGDQVCTTLAFSAMKNLGVFCTLLNLRKISLVTVWGNGMKYSGAPAGNCLGDSPSNSGRRITDLKEQWNRRAYIP